MLETVSYRRRRYWRGGANSGYCLLLLLARPLTLPYLHTCKLFALLCLMALLAFFNFYFYLLLLLTYFCLLLLLTSEYLLHYYTTYTTLLTWTFGGTFGGIFWE
ncbi:hypothetical protein BZA05DRAFT_412348 [Tricharina praecox]|uniref:uncharacterized protein n=1 Tax=Tricharina praecox TaxID=43433 RepID=UPI00222028A8|nr:uncharacterized protein BZA05DRAFT_412348 [Tricharina praecox]KAI5842323.1 hypothetical protein BZA05DRAFT_412348 [Tricharina praecox]